MIYGVNTDGGYWHAIASGVISDYGPAVSINLDGQVDPAHNSEMELRLTYGSFRLSIAALDKAFVNADSHAPIYPKTCTDLVGVTGPPACAARASTRTLATASASAARRHPARRHPIDLPAAMAAYVTRALSREPCSQAEYVHRLTGKQSRVLKPAHNQAFCAWGSARLDPRAIAPESVIWSHVGLKADHSLSPTPVPP